MAALLTRIKDLTKRLVKRYYLLFRRYYYKGKKYKCPVCGHEYRTMLPGGYESATNKKYQIIGAGLREKNICPGCLATDRDRLILLYLRDKLNIEKTPYMVFHASPEPALYGHLNKLKNLDYTIGTKYAEGTYYPDRIQSVDLLQLPWPDNSFDIIICNHVLEHINDDLKAMSEIHRVLVPGGKAILQVPYSKLIEHTLEDRTITSAEEREKAFGQFDHVRIYGLDYIKRLEKAGFKVNHIFPGSETWKINGITKFALNAEEGIFLAEKNS